jgi:hypothetical protein
MSIVLPQTASTLFHRVLLVAPAAGVDSALGYTLVSADAGKGIAVRHTRHTRDTRHTRHTPPHTPIHTIHTTPRKACTILIHSALCTILILHSALYSSCTIHYTHSTGGETVPLHYTHPTLYTTLILQVVKQCLSTILILHYTLHHTLQVVKQCPYTHPALSTTLILQVVKQCPSLLPQATRRAG